MKKSQLHELHDEFDPTGHLGVRFGAAVDDTCAAATAEPPTSARPRRGATTAAHSTVLLSHLGIVYVRQGGFDLLGVVLRPRHGAATVQIFHDSTLAVIKD